MVFLDDYSRIPNNYCSTNGNDGEFSEILTAKENCSKDENCAGFYDRFGAGTTYRLCNQPLDIQESTSGSILYRPSGKTIYFNFIFDFENLIKFYPQTYPAAC